jgi:hypothetical protein
MGGHLNMNSIQQFLHENKSFSVPVLLNAFFRLSILQLNQGFLSFEDIIEAVRVVCPETIAAEEITAYSGVIYESILVPSLYETGPVLCMKEEVIGKETAFLECLSKKVVHKYGKDGVMCSGVLALERDTQKFLLLKSSKETVQAPSPSLSGKGSNAGTAVSSSDHLPSPLVTDRDPLEREIPSHYDPYFSNNSVPGDVNSWGSLEPAMGENLTLYQEFLSPNILQSRQAEEFTDSNNPDMTNPINRFLAHIRKSGMEILFPQIVHDKVSIAPVFVACCYISTYLMSFFYFVFVDPFNHLCRTKKLWITDASRTDGHVNAG